MCQNFAVQTDKKCRYKFVYNLSRTRNQYGVIVKEKIAKKREEILKEQLAKYVRIFSNFQKLFFRFGVYYRQDLAIVLLSL